MIISFLNSAIKRSTQRNSCMLGSQKIFFSVLCVGSKVECADGTKRLRFEDTIVWCGVQPAVSSNTVRGLTVSIRVWRVKNSTRHAAPCACNARTTHYSLPLSTLIHLHADQLQPNQNMYVQ